MKISKKPIEGFSKLSTSDQLLDIAWTRIWTAKDLIEAKGMPKKAYLLIRNNLIEVMEEIIKWDYPESIEGALGLLGKTTTDVVSYLIDDKDKVDFFTNQMIYSTSEHCKLLK